MEQELSFLEDLKLSLLGEPSLAKYIAFTFFVLFSMSLVKFVRYNKKKKEMLRQDPPKRIKFNWSTWRSDNILDYITAFMSAFILFRFLPEGGHYITSSFNLQPLSEVMAYGVILGAGFQYIWHRILNKVKV